MILIDDKIRSITKLYSIYLLFIACEYSKRFVQPGVQRMVKCIWILSVSYYIYRPR